MLYEMNFGGLTPITVEGLELGDAVRYAHNGGLYWVIGQDMHGYTIANESGEQHHGQRLGTLSPYTRISKDSEFARLDSSEIAQLKQACEYKRDNDRIAAEQAKQRHADAFASAVESVRAEFPTRVSEDANLSRHARAAKNIRLQLKAAFPNTKFSVKSESYSMGDNINVRWTLGPSEAEVAAIVDRYQEGHFDGMQDLYEYDNRAESEAFHSLMGCTKYAFTNREIPSDFQQQVINDIRSSYGTPPDEWELSRQAYQAIAPVSLYNAEYAGVECSSGRFQIVATPLV